VVTVTFVSKLIAQRIVDDERKLGNFNPSKCRLQPVLTVGKSHSPFKNKG
jgi:hypothetical protein